MQQPIRIEPDAPLPELPEKGVVCLWDADLRGPAGYPIDALFESADMIIVDFNDHDAERLRRPLRMSERLGDAYLVLVLLVHPEGGNAWKPIIEKYQAKCGGALPLVTMN